MKPLVVSAARRFAVGHRRPLLNRTAMTSSCSSSPSSSSSSPLVEALPFLKQELARFDARVPVESAVTPPASWFTSPAFHALEMASVFANHPVCVGSALQLPHPGDYFCGQVGPHPFIVWRDGNHDIKAFYNVCRHKGMRLVAGDQGRLNKPVLACPYHGWEYRLDGRLAKATRVAGIKDFAPKDYGLVEIPVQTWGPLLFLEFGRAGKKRREEEKDPLAHLKPLQAQLDAEHGFFSTGLRHVERRSYRVMVG